MLDQNMLKEKMQEVRDQIEKSKKLFRQGEPSATTEMKKGLRLARDLLRDINNSMDIILKKINAESGRFRSEPLVENPLDILKRIIADGIAKPKEELIPNVVFPRSKYLN